MEYCITSAHVMEGTGAHENSICRWMQDTPRLRRKSAGRHYYYLYRLDDVVTTLRRVRRGGLRGAALAALVALDVSRDDPSDHLGDDADARAAALHAAFAGDEKERFARVAKWAGQGATYALWSKQHLYDHGRALALLALRPAVLAYILTGQRRYEFPTTRDAWGDYMAAHVVSVATPDEIKKLTSR